MGWQWGRFQRFGSEVCVISLTLFFSCKKWDLPRLNDSLNDGLISYYAFNGSTVDESGNNLHGRMINGAAYGPDRNGAGQSALLLDGVDDYFEIPDNVRLRPESISISLWMKARRIASTSHIYNKSNYSDHQNQQYSAFIRPPSPQSNNGACCEIWADINQDGLCSEEQPIQQPVIYYDPTYQTDRWYHLVTVFSGSTGKIYVNGDLKWSANEQPQKNIDPCAGANLRFGAQASYDVNFFDGMMDEIRIYNRSLTDAEVKRLYKQ